MNCPRDLIGGLVLLLADTADYPGQFCRGTRRTLYLSSIHISFGRFRYRACLCTLFTDCSPQERFKSFSSSLEMPPPTGKTPTHHRHFLLHRHQVESGSSLNYCRQLGPGPRSARPTCQVEIPVGVATLGVGC